ncbi:MAG: ECF transporter S component [Bacillota bacterium]
MDTKKLTYSALILGLALVFQSLRLIVPIPPVVAPFVIGSLVNACLLIATTTVGLKSGLIISLITPFVAYMQGQLPLPLFIVPIFIGNGLLVSCYWLLERKARIAAVVVAALAKTIALFIMFSALLAFISLPDKLATALMFTMSWPQLVSGVAGGVIAIIVLFRIKHK